MAIMLPIIFSVLKKLFNYFLFSNIAKNTQRFRVLSIISLDCIEENWSWLD